jgi:hypothetical protein
MRSHHWNSRGAVGLLVLLAASAASAQRDPAYPGVPVNAVVTVEARHGKEVPEVRAEDVVVMQGKQRDPVASWQPISETNRQFFILIDDALSTPDLGTKLRDIASFITSQPANTAVGVAYMRNGTAVISQQLTTDHAQAAKALRLPVGYAGAGGSPYFALEDLLKRWQPADAAREVVMISDGIEPFFDGHDLSDPYVNSAIEQAQRAGIVVNALYARGAGHSGHTFWRINWGQTYLSQLADETGGEAYFLANDSAVSFSPYFKELNERMQHQFLLTFEAQPGKKSGMQSIKLATEVERAELVAQTQVYVPVS